MQNFEDIARSRIIEATLRDVPGAASVSLGSPEGAKMDKNDLEVFASMVYALLRAGARREGQEAFRSAFLHFADNGRGYSSEELEYIRKALIIAVEKHASEARALRVYFASLEGDKMSKEEATDLAMGILEEEEEG